MREGYGFNVAPRAAAAEDTERLSVLDGLAACEAFIPQALVKPSAIIPPPSRVIQLLLQ